MGLRTKFNLVFVIVFLFGFAGTGFALHGLFERHARNEVLQQARIMLEAANAIRNYTTTQVNPLIMPLNLETFQPISVPGFAAQTNLRQVREKYPNYVYKEAALNPTNPIDRASDWEADIIQAFRNTPDRKELIAQRNTPTGRSLVLAHPITVGDPQCLTCHSVPANAPASMIRKYGADNGFGWQLHETIGAQIVSVPMAVPLSHADAALRTVMGVLAAVFVVILILLNVLLHYVVIRPVVRMSRIATAVSLGEADVEEYERRGKDEIAALSAAFNRMRRSLQSAMKMLEG
jgi:protein-histidine pros-kinase